MNTFDRLRRERGRCGAQKDVGGLREAKPTQKCAQKLEAEPLPVRVGMAGVSAGNEFVVALHVALLGLL
jgi:hypothetical protein